MIFVRLKDAEEALTKLLSDGYATLTQVAGANPIVLAKNVVGATVVINVPETLTVDPAPVLHPTPGPVYGGQ